MDDSPKPDPWPIPPANQRYKCPWCQHEVVMALAKVPQNHSPSASVSVYDPTVPAQHTGMVLVWAVACPVCARACVMLHSSAGKSTRWVWPEGLQRRAIPDMVPDAVGQDYKEAALVLDRSPRASAALSRRALQGLLTEQGFKHSNLSTQIDLALPGLAEPLKSDIDAIRQLGNMAAHPMKATQSGEILDVEPGEAEWSLDVLDALFDHYYVEKERSSARRAALNAKLKSAGKPPLK